MTKEEFIAKAEAQYGKGKYNYDEVDYKGNKIKVKIHCNICGEDFWKRPNDFLSGSECYCQHEHLTPRNYTLDDYKKQLTRDKNVRDYCKEHDIFLIEIPYTYTKYEILKPILEDILFNEKSPEDIIIYPEIEMYAKFFKT